MGFSNIYRTIQRLPILFKPYCVPTGEITEHETKINLHLLSKKVGEGEKTIKKVLKQLQADGVAEYQTSNSDLEIQFLVPREDDRTINPFAKKIKDFNAVKQKNMAAMLDYIQNTRVCRSVFILNYFGEKTSEKCATCDICTQKDSVPSEGLKKTILKTLMTAPQTSRQLEQVLGIEEKLILKALQELLEDERIGLNARNEYEIEK